MDNYLDIPSPFALPKPKDHWLRTLAAFDADLVIFPSQKQPLYRLARRAKRSGGITERIFRKVGSMLHPDTKIMFDNRLVAVTTIPRGAVEAPCEILCQQLIPRDTWRFGPGDDAGARSLERMEHEEAERQNRAWKEETRARHRAARISFLYRTGARVSLISPLRPPAGGAAPGTPAASAASVSPQED